jgi:hypothetical protein
MFPAPDWGQWREVERLFEPRFRDLGWIGRACGLVDNRDRSVRDELQARSAGLTISTPGLEGYSNRCDDLTSWHWNGYSEYMVDSDTDCEFDDDDDE